MSQITKPPKQLWKRGRWILSLCWTSWSVGVWWFKKRNVELTGRMKVGDVVRGQVVFTRVGGFDLGPLSLEFREKWRKP